MRRRGGGMDKVAWARALGAPDVYHLHENLGDLWMAVTNHEEEIEELRAEVDDVPDPELGEALSTASRALQQAGEILVRLRAQVRS